MFCCIPVLLWQIEAVLCLPPDGMIFIVALGNREATWLIMCTMYGALDYGGGYVMKNSSVGSSFDDFLKEENIYEEVQAFAIKRVIAWQLEQVMEADSVTKAEMAKRMHTN